MGLKRYPAQNLQRAISLMYIARFDRRRVRVSAIAHSVDGADHAFSDRISRDRMIDAFVAFFAEHLVA